MCLAIDAQLAMPSGQRFRHPLAARFASSPLVSRNPARTWRRTVPWRLGADAASAAPVSRNRQAIPLS